MAVQPPLPESGLTIQDIKKAIKQAKEDQENHPAIKLITENVPDEYQPEEEDE